MLSVNPDQPFKSELKSLHPISIGTLLSHSIEHNVIKTFSTGLTFGGFLVY